jgi:hypothetical protein
MIESRTGLAIAGELAAVPGVDYLSFGMLDLAQSLGHPGNSDHPEVKAGAADAAGRIRAAGKRVREDFMHYAWINDVLIAGARACSARGGLTLERADDRIAVLDGGRGRSPSADWSVLQARADVTFYTVPFPDEDAAARELADFDIVLAIRERTPFPASLLRRLPKLRMFGLTGTRAALIDIAAMIDRGITVCHTGGGPSVASTAELALGLLLAAARRIPAGDAAVRAGRFQQGTRAGMVLRGKHRSDRLGGSVYRYCRC